MTFSRRSGLPTQGGRCFGGFWLQPAGNSAPDTVGSTCGPISRELPLQQLRTTEGAIAASLKTGKTWDELSEERLYRKIGMQSTSSRNSDYENNPNKAALHALVDIQNNTYKNWFVPKVDAESPAGSVSSNVRDMARWLRLQLNGGVFDGEQVWIGQLSMRHTSRNPYCDKVQIDVEQDHLVPAASSARCLFRAEPLGRRYLHALLRE